MKRKKARIFGVVMALVLAVALASVGVAPISAEPGTVLEWSQIPIPDADDLQLYPGSDVGPIAVTPDGETLFAAAFNESAPAATAWQVYKSTDGGYTWKETGLAGALTTQSDTTPIVDIGLSPNWVDDGYIFVATEDYVYRSHDRGKNFGAIGIVPGTDPDGGTDVITSMDVGLDERGDWTVVACTYGATSDVYLLVYGEWVPQDVDTGLVLVTGNVMYGVLDVAFSPNYADDGMILAVVNTETCVPPLTNLNVTMLRTETQAALTDADVGNWNAYVSDAPFYHNGAIEDGHGIVAERASIAFADDFATIRAVFVGLTAYYTPGDVASPPRGDVFRVDFVTGMITPSGVTDLNIRGTETSPHETNVWSLAISGDASSAFMLAGVESMSFTGPTAMMKSSVHYSSNGGASWLPSYKPPAGVDFAALVTGEPLRGYPIVVMAPDFAESGIAYCGTGGGNEVQFTGFYVSTTQGTTWNGRGLLDHSIADITDIAPSPNYATDETLLMVTPDGVLTGVGLLWKTTDGGIKWELINSMLALFPLWGCLFTKVELPPNYPTDPSIFLTGPEDLEGNPCLTILRSTDEGNLFLTPITAPAVVTAWDVVDMNTIFTGDANGNVYRTTAAGATWAEPDESEIPAGADVLDLVVEDGAILVGTDGGEVYICYDWREAFEFVRVGVGPGSAGDELQVAFDANYAENSIIYAGLSPGSGAEIWRFDLSDEYARWRQISDASAWVPCGPMDVVALECADNGVLYAIDINNTIGWRSVYPTDSPIDLEVDLNEQAVPYFEPVYTGLGWTAVEGTVYRDLEVVPGSDVPLSNILFSIGEDAATNPALWAFRDTLIKPLLASPDNGATTGTILEGGTTASVELSWNALEGAERYQIQVARDELFGTVVDERLWTEGTMDVVDLSVGTPYYWRVRVASPNETYLGGTLTLLTWKGAPLMSQWSEPRSFTTVLGPAEALPVLVNPEPSAIDEPLKPMFEWIPVSGATGYEFQVATTSDFSTGVVIDKTGANALGLVTAYQPTTDLEYDTTYFWHVKAIGVGTESPWSATGSFTTIAEPEAEATPAWVWVVIALSVVLLIAVIVLIMRTRRPV